MPDECQAQKCKAQRCDGIGFLETIFTAWIGASIAVGSCGSCNSSQKLESHVDQQLQEMENNLERTFNQRLLETENNLIQRVGDSDIVPGGIYTIDGKEYQLVPVEQNQPTP